MAVLCSFSGRNWRGRRGTISIYQDCTKDEPKERGFGGATDTRKTSKCLIVLCHAAQKYESREVGGMERGKIKTRDSFRGKIDNSQSSGRYFAPFKLHPWQTSSVSAFLVCL